MAFIVEDGTGLADSTSYVSLEYAELYADSFFSETDYTLWSVTGNDSLQRLLNRASKYLDRTYVFNGELYSSTQALQFPRAYLYDNLGYDITGVPSAIEQATCIVAMKMLNGINLDPDVGRKTIREKIDTIDITYSEAASNYKRYTEIDNLLTASGIIQGNRNRRTNIRVIQG